MGGLLADDSLDQGMEESEEPEREGEHGHGGDDHLAGGDAAEHDQQLGQKQG